MKVVKFEGKEYRFPTDATDAEIDTFLGGDAPAKKAAKPGGLFPAVTAPQHMPPIKSFLGLKGQDKGERIGELAPGAPEPKEFTDPGPTVRAGVGALALAGVPALAASMGAPGIAATSLPARMAGGVTPASVEPTFAEVAALILGAAQKGGDAMKAVAANPHVQSLAKWLMRGAAAGAGLEGIRRNLK